MKQEMAEGSELKDATGKEYRGTIFTPQAQAAFAKAIIFAAEAKVANKSRHFIWAAIACYYSLFHLTISLMFMVPRLIDQKKLLKLINDRQEGASDPTVLIQYWELDGFLRNCESRGLTDRLRKQLRKSKELREFVNYKPRIEWQDESLIFRTKAHRPTDVQNVLASVESLLGESLVWGKQQEESSELVALVSVFSIKQFLTQDDLMYKVWCPSEVLDEAELIRLKLPIRID
jgi:hypothetical protein